MPVDPEQARALDIPPISTTVERGRLAFFATATGQTDPVYADVAAARAVGHPDLPVPPTFFFSLELEQADPFGWVAELGIDMRTVLHGEQSFSYHATAHAGDQLVLRPQIVDVTSKKNGTLDVISKQTTVTRDGQPIAETASVLVVRHREAS